MQPYTLRARSDGCIQTAVSCSLSPHLVKSHAAATARCRLNDRDLRLRAPMPRLRVSATDTATDDAVDVLSSVSFDHTEEGDYCMPGEVSVSNEDSKEETLITVSVSFKSLGLRVQ